MDGRILTKVEHTLHQATPLAVIHPTEQSIYSVDQEKQVRIP